MKHPSALASRAAKLVTGCGLAILLCGCVETTAQREPLPQVPRSANMARRDGISPHGASVAIAEVQGVALPVSQRLARFIDEEANTRDINLTDVKSANYLVQGYLNASPAEGGAVFEVVWDVYDSKKRRAQRIADGVFVKDAAPLAETIDDVTLSRIAAKSTDDLAAVLTNMPEAIAAASKPGGKTTSVARAAEEGMTVVSGTSPSATPASPELGRDVAAASR